MKLVYSTDYQSPAVHKYLLRNDEGTDITLIGTFHGLVEGRSPDGKNWTRMSAYKAIDGTHYVNTETVSIIDEEPFIGSKSVQWFSSAEDMVHGLPASRLTSNLIASLGIVEVRTSDIDTQSKQSQSQDHWQPYPFSPR